MRICSPQLALDDDSPLGGSVADRELLRALAAQDVDTDVPILHLPTYEPPQAWRLRPLRFRPTFRGARAILQVLFLLSILTARRSGVVDAVRVFEASYVGLPALLARIFTRVPVVTHLHHVDDDVPPWQRRLEGFVARRSDAVVVPSEFTAEQARVRFGVPREAVHIVPLGVSPAVLAAKYDQLPEAVGVQDGDTLVLSVGVLRRRKNLPSLVRCFARAFADDERAVLVIVGPEHGSEPGQLAALKALAESLGIGARVRLAGHVSEQEKIALHRRADIYATTSRREGFGLAVAEALASATPVVAMAGGATAELVTPGAGIVVSDGDEDAMVAALERVAAQSPEQRAVMAAVAEARGRTLTWETSARAFRSVLLAVSA